ncbi:MAG TPA: glycosyltransferase [Levilinea sp.]|nr:glycosyltransferase [Levilinea sp.]
MFDSPYLENTKTPTAPAIFLLGGQMAEDGVQSALVHQARWFYGRGYRVVAAFLGDAEGLHGRWQARLPVPLVNLRALRTGANPISGFFHALIAAFRASRLFAIGEFDMIETFGAEANLFGLPLARLAGVPVRVANYPCQPAPVRLKRIHTRVINRFATRVVAGAAWSKQLGIADGISAERIAVVPRGVAKAEEIDWQLRRRLRSELEIPDDGCLIVSAGGLHSAQAYDELLLAAPRLLEQFPQCYFALTGEGPARPNLVQRARQLGIAAHLRFPGRRPDLLRLIAAADIYFLPLSDQGLPPYLLEAMAARRPIIAIDSQPVREFVQPGQSALLVEPGAPERLSNALISLISDVETRTRIGSSAYECIQLNHGLEQMCAHYADLLDPSYHVEVS